MNTDFLIEMGFPGLTGRLKRLNDLFVYQTKEFYKERGIEIEPNWHMVFSLLQKHKSLTNTEISEMLQLSHPAIVKLVNKMKKKGYLKSIQDPDDQRKYQISLSKKAEKELPEMEKLWELGSQAIEELLGEDNVLLEKLSVLESNMADLNFKERMEKKLEEEN
ncbi:MAG: MarR family winged helix-turn-helix transcriptional regulator [Psychroflexus sp.]|uniref:MarR family winged helix-turn-helix transcriptional regulator n=1 Tax=Psychroflexus sp. S27 TaxID=1982757 RepID=UPI000C2AC3F6|nr:MarR family transcriptional regulator [Psychroflexus sp. S27]PJX21796.1 MarR family transcriptional regulator [Psychroflexus sp. S27]